VRRKGLKYTRGQPIPCPKCGYETRETKDLSMSTRNYAYSRQRNTVDGYDYDDDYGASGFSYGSGGFSYGSSGYSYGTTSHADDEEDDESDSDEDEEDGDEEDGDEDDRHGTNEEIAEVAENLSRLKVQES